jgi:hypothetical protein
VLDLFIKKLNRHEAEIIVFPNLYASGRLIGESERVLNPAVQDRADHGQRDLRKA